MDKIRSSLKNMIYPLCCALSVAASVGLCVYVYRESATREPVEVLIETGQTASDVAEALVNAGIVQNRRIFLWRMKQIELDRFIKPGWYHIRPGNAFSVARQLQDAKPIVPEVRILPGALFDDVVAALSETGAGDLLLEALSDDLNFPEDLRPYLPRDADDRLVLLTPETYSVPPGSDGARNLVRAASVGWWRLHGESVKSGDRSEGLREEAILASIIQKEAVADEERPTMAGVFVNRMKKSMPLQSCATVVYAWKLKGEKRTKLNYGDLEIDSPYNTYTHSGLPPRHIGIPSGNSWEAALNPGQTDALFFVAASNGRHVFSRTYSEHLAAKRRIEGVRN